MSGTSEKSSSALECPVCCELFNNAVETFCGHAFCEYCINKALESGPMCPICRSDPIPIHPSFVLRRLADDEKSKRGYLDSPTSEVQNKSVNASQKHHLGNSSYRHGQFAEAIKHYNSALKTNPTSVLYGNRAACYFKLKQYRSALEDYERAEKLNPTNVKIVLGKAYTLERLREYEESYDTFKHALALCNQEDILSRNEVLEGIQRMAKHAAAVSTELTTTTTTTKTTTTTTTETTETTTTTMTTETRFQPAMSTYQLAPIQQQPAPGNVTLPSIQHLTNPDYGTELSLVSPIFYPQDGNSSLVQWSNDQEHIFKEFFGS